jgi:hypothetical protein
MSDASHPPYAPGIGKFGPRADGRAKSGDQATTIAIIRNGKRIDPCAEAQRGDKAC